MTDSLRLKAAALSLALLISPAFASARAERLYKQGDYAGAVAASEEEYAKSGSRGAKADLIRYLTELGLEMSFQENYKSAEYAFSRALALAPNDPTLKDLVATVKDLGSYPARDTAPEKEVKTKAPPKPAAPAPAPRAAPPDRAYMKQQIELINKLEKLADSIEKKSAADAKLHEKTLRETTGSINAAISDSLSNIKKAFILTALSVAGAAALLLLAAFLLVRYAIGIQRAPGDGGENKAIIGLKQKAKRIPLIESESDTKYEGIEIIEAELSSEDSTESGVAQKLLEPFLNDPDPELKMRAIRAMYKYSPAEAAGLIEQETLKGPEGIKIFCSLAELMPPDMLKKNLSKINRKGLDAKLCSKIDDLSGISSNDDLIID